MRVDKRFARDTSPLRVRDFLKLMIFLNSYLNKMDFKMEIIAFLLYGLIAAVTSITITSNGNSPKIKMIGGMMVDMEKGFEPMITEETSIKREHIKPITRKITNSTKLSINERYRRLIPYMTFYYANDLATPNTGQQKEVEIQKAQIVEAGIQREQKKIIYAPPRNIPRYQGNRLTQHNIASANPTKIYYKGGVQVHPTQSTVSHNYNPLLSDYVLVNHGYDSDQTVYKHIPKNPSVAFITSTRKPYLNLNNEDAHNIRYYFSEKEPAPKYKLIPYEQTPPVKVNGYENMYEVNKKPIPVAVYIPKEPIYSKPRPPRPYYAYESNVDPTVRRQPVIVSESYYEKQRPVASIAEPIIQGGFKPILESPQYTKEHFYSTGTPAPILDDEPKEQQELVIQPQPARTVEIKPNYYQYVVEPTTTKPPVRSSTMSLATILNTLQLNKSIPKPITNENVGTSIRTLLQVLNALKAVPQHTEIEVPVLSTPKPFVPNKVVEIIKSPVEDEDIPAPIEKPGKASNADLHDEPYLAEVNPPSQHLDDGPTYGGTSQRFPLPVSSDDEGGTPGRAGVDYPTLTVIPQTRFNCKTQRYKGFFADPETRCQVWHYCDLNGGQASFLCPNGTIFSQAGLTCDWWFNVRCASTTQLYVLNESLYKYILPHSPKFPEDYSGPLVDKYLTLKFKEMEEEFKKNKNKKSKTEKSDSSEDSEETEESKDVDDSTEHSSLKDKMDEKIVDEASVILESPGTSGQLERLQDD